MATFCDGVKREFTTKFTHASGSWVGYAATFGIAEDPLDCCALTREEAEAFGARIMRKRAETLGGYGVNYTAFEVVPLPAGWN